MKRDTPPRLPSTPVDAETLLHALMAQPVPPIAPGAADELRERLVPRLEAYRAELARRRAVRLRWLVFGAAACLPAVVAAGSMLLGRSHGRRAPTADVVELAGNAEVARGGTKRALHAPAEATLDSSEELLTGPDSIARASLPTGAVVAVGPSSRVQFEPAGDAEHGRLRDRVELVAGKVEVEVPKLADGDELSVHTEGATVVVHGTKFTVERASFDGRPPATRVTVSEGKVAVYTQDAVRMLTAGTTWVIGGVPEVSPEASSALPVQGGAIAVAAGSQASSAMTSSTLAAENRLLADAMQLHRLGDNARALARLDELIARHPGSPLAETARVERMRVLADLSEAGARGP